MNTFELESKFGSGIYPKRDIAIVKGQDAYIWDDKGNKYIDCVSGVGSVNIGHCNKEVIKAIDEQCEKLMSCFGIFYNDTRAKCLEKLASILPSGLNRGFLCNSGAEANEAAFKFARVSTHKTEIIAAKNGFHGRTFGALSATFKPSYRKPFEPLVPGFKFVRFNDIEDLKHNITENTAAVILEIVQGEGGIIIGSREYFQEVRKLCDEKKILLIIDEAQTGFGRTGKMFACEHYDIIPDMITLAKSIAGGLPMGAVFFNEKVNIPRKLHGSTFGGNPVMCAASTATIDFIQKNRLVEKSAELGKYAKERLMKINSSKIRDLRAIGLMIGIELKEKPSKYLKMLAEEGVMALPAGATVLRLLPPLVISKDDMDLVIEKIEKVLK